MKLLYIIWLVGAFLMGMYDGGDMTYFVFVLFIGAVVMANKLTKKKKTKKVGE